MTPEEREELLAAYALGTLSAPDAEAVEDLVRSDGAAAAELAAYHELVDMIALSAPLRRADPRLRGRVMDAARRQSVLHQRRGAGVRRFAPWVAAAAVLVLVVFWGANIQRELHLVERENRSLTAIVEADAKRIDELVTGVATDTSSAALRLALESALADQQLTLAVTTDPDAISSTLQPTPSGHGAGGRYLWSESLSAGVIVTRALPPLPIGSVYQVWLEDGTFVVPGPTFVPDSHGDAEVVVQPAVPIEPGRMLIAPSPTGGAADVGRPIVLVGLLTR